MPGPVLGDGESSRRRLRLGAVELFPARQKTVNQWAADHTCYLGGASPILALDMYEHSYHMDYGAKAAAYVDAYIENIS